MSTSSELPAPPRDLFSDGGENGAALRAIDWSRKSVGQPDRWPPCLRTALGLCLSAREPACLLWSEDRLLFYNDACREIIGQRHPWALGESYTTVWPESDSVITPLVAHVRETGEATRCDDLLLGVRRGGRTQEGYFSFSCSPVRLETGAVGGVFVTLAETTGKVVREQRLRTLRTLAHLLRATSSPEAVGRLAADVLTANPHDVPFVWLYLVAPDRHSVRLLNPPAPESPAGALPGEVSLASDRGADPWRLREATRSLRPLVVSPLPAPGETFATTPWPEPVDTAVVRAIPASDGDTGAFLVCGVSPRRPLDEEYQDFLGLAADQIGFALARVQAAGPAPGSRPAFLTPGSRSPFARQPTRRRVLVVEPDPVHRAECLRQLQDRYDVAGVPDNAAALALAHQWQPELVLAAAEPPGPAGQDFMAALHADARTRLVPVILTAAAGEGARAAALAAGADDFLPHPFDLRELLARVQSQLQLAELRRHAEARIVASEMRLEQLVAMMPAGVSAVDAEGRVTFYNPRAAEIWQATPPLHESYAAFAGRFKNLDAAGGVVPTEHRPVATVLREGRAISRQESSFERPDGSRFHLSYSISPTFDAEGRINGAISVFQDITAERQAHIALRATEERYRAVFQQAAVGIFECDLDGRILHGNPALSRMVGFTEAELQELNWRQLIAPDELAEQALIADRLRRGELTTFNGERRLVRKDGVIIWLDVFATTVLTDGGQPAYGLVILVDITERKRTEAELRETELRFRLAADNAPVLIWIAASDRRRTWFNQPWLEFVGRTLEQETGLGWVDNIHPEDRERTLEIYARAFEQQQPFRLEYRLRRHDGAYRWVLAHGVPRHQDTAFAGFIGSCVDITDRRLAEEAMQESRNAERTRREELELARDQAVAASRAKDDFLAALSHELRTPLSPVLLLASDAASDPALPPAVRADFETIRKSVELEARLIDDLLDLTRIVRDRITLDLREVDVPLTLRDSLVAVRPEFSAKEIGLVLDLAPEPHAVWGDPVRLQQVFWNVLKNAVKFTPQGGRVTITTRVDHAARRVFVEVADTGIGLTAAEIERVFQAFSQGDHARRGSHQFGGLGLGLAISQRIVALHHGQMTADSPGRDRGAVFRIELPLWTSPTAAPAPAPAPATSPTLPDMKSPELPRRVLLVEDHAPTRTALKSLLTRRGYDVTVAANAAEARAAAAQGTFSLLVSDIGLPDGSGYELMREFRASHGLRGIALTGYGMEDDLARSREAGFSQHLTKPVRIQHLDQALAALDQPPP